MAEDTQLHIEKWTRLLIIVSTLLVLTTFVAVIVRLSIFIHHTLLLFSLGALVAYALDPIVEGLRRRPARPLWTRPRRNTPAEERNAQRRMMPRAASIVIVFAILLALIGLGVYGLSKPLANQVKLLSDKNQQQAFLQRADIVLRDMDGRLSRLGVNAHLDDYLHNPDTIPQSVKDAAKKLEGDALPAIRDIAVSVGEGAFVLFIALYLLIYSGEMRQKVNAQMPRNLLVHAEVWEEDVNRILGGFVRGQLMIAFVMGACAAIGCLLLGIHIWLLIGIFVVIASLIPVFGPYLGAVPAVIAALIEPTHVHNAGVAAIIVIAFFVVINEVGSKVLYPRLVGQAIGLHEVMVLFVIIAGLEIDGIVGVLFAAPLTAIAMVTLVHLYRFWLDLPDSLLSARNEASEHDGSHDGNGPAGGAASDGETVGQMRATVEG